MDERLTIKKILRTYWLLLLAPLLLLGPMLVRGQVLFWGTPSLQFVSWWAEAWDSLRQGSLPLWNSLNGMGAPLLANYQLAFFYPPNWLLLLLAALGGPESTAERIAWGYTALAMLHLAWAGLGMALLLRRLRLRWLGQIIGGLAYGLSGYIVGRLAFFSMVWVAAWLPWVILFADQIASPVADSQQGGKGKLRILPGLALCFGMQFLAGHAQLTWYTILLSGLWVTVWAWVGCLSAGSLPLRVRAQRMGWAWLSFAAALALGAGLAAVQLVPTFEYLRLSHRADAVAYAEAMTYSFWPWRFLTLFSPDFFGSPAGGDFWGYASYWEDHFYAGIVPLLLAITSLFLLVKRLVRPGRGPYQRLLVFLWSGLLVTFMLALGQNTPVFPFLYQHVPTFAMFQAPVRYLIWAAFALPVLAAVAVEHWRSPTGRGLYWFRLGTAGAFAITLGAGLAYLLMQNIRLTFVRATALTGMWALGFGLLTLVIPYAQKRGQIALWQGAVIAWTMFDLLFTGWSLNPGVPSSFYAGQSSAAYRTESELALSAHRVYLSKQEEYDLKFRRFLRFRDFNPLEDWRNLRNTLIPDLNLLDGVAMINNFDPLVPERYARWLTEVETLDPTTRAAWLAQVGVLTVERIDVSAPSGVRFDRVADSARWWFYPCAQTVKDSESAWVVMAQRFEGPAAEAQAPLIVEDAAQPASSGCTTGVQMDVFIMKKSERPDQLVLEVQAPMDGWLYVADTWYPGWQAQVDSSTTQIYPANYLFRAVKIAAGTHQVSLIYRSFGFYFGEMFSILVMFFMLYLFIRRGRNSTDDRPSQ